MAAKKLNELAERKRLLALEGDLHRSLIDLECAGWRARLHSARAGIQSGSPWLLAGSAVASFFAARHWRKLAGWVPAALTAWRLLRG